MRFPLIIFSIVVFGFCFSACKSGNAVLGLFKKGKTYQAHFTKPKNTFHSKAIINPSDTNEILITEPYSFQDLELTASKKSSLDYSDYPQKPIYDQSVKSSFDNEDSDEVEKKGTKVLEGFGVTSLILSILGILIWPLLIPAIIFGILSLSRHSRFPDSFRGKVSALIGLIISSIAVLGFAALFGVLPVALITIGIVALIMALMGMFRKSKYNKVEEPQENQNEVLEEKSTESHKEPVNEAKRKKTTKTLDILAAILGLGAAISIFSFLPELFLGFGLGALALALISKSLKPKKIKAEKPKNNREKVLEEKPKPEPLTAEERKALEIEKLGFFGATSGLFALILTFMALGPYLFSSILLFVPVLAAMSFLFGISSLKNFKDNPQKFRGRGFAYTGLGIGLLYLLLTLFLVIYYFSFILY